MLPIFPNDTRLYKRHGFRRALLTAAVIIFLISAVSAWAQPESFQDDSALMPLDSPDDLLWAMEGRYDTPQLDRLIGEEPEGLIQLSQKVLEPDPPSAAWNAWKPGSPLANSLKLNGRHLYVAPYTEIDLAVTLDSDAETAPSGIADERPVIRVLEVKGNRPAALEVGAISLEDHLAPISGLHLFEDSGGPGVSYLVTVGNRRPESWYFWASYGYWQRQISEVAVYDISTAVSPRPMARLTVDGQLLASRRIGHILYLVTRFVPPPPGNQRSTINGTGGQSFRRSAGELGLSDRLPAYSVDGASRSSLVAMDSCYLAPREKGTDSGGSLITITAIDVTEPNYPLSQSVFGLVEAFHIGPGSLYLATVRSNPRPGTGFDDLQMDEIGDDHPVSRVTDIHKFDLPEDGPIYRGSGSIGGRLKGNVADRRFSLSEHDGVLRVVTQNASKSGDEPTVGLSLLEEVPRPESPSSLVETSRLDNLESVAGSRFDLRFSADLGYLLPINPSLPIRLLDLSDRGRPQIGAELPESSGIERLVPVGLGFYVGIGKNRPVEETGQNSAYPSARGDGIELVLVNAADPKAPEWVDTLVIGAEGSESDALLQPQSIYAVLQPDGRSVRVALPIELYDREEEEPTGSFEPSLDSGTVWIHTGLYLFDVCLATDCDDAPGFELVDTVLAAKATEGRRAAWRLERGSDRLIVIDDSVYYYHRGQIWPAGWKPAEATP